MSDGDTCGYRCDQRPRSRTLEKFVQQASDSSIDLVDDGPDLIDRAAGGVRQLPVEIALARVDGARVAAAHRDNDVGISRHVIGEALWGLACWIEASLLEQCHHDRVELSAWF